MGPFTIAIISEWPSYPLKQWRAGTLVDQASPDSVSWRLDDMLSTLFDHHIINYEPLRGFMVLKFMTYDGTSNPFVHIMHYRQLMTLDIGNDTLLCKVFLASLHGQALSWFHLLWKNSVNNFWNLSEAFVGHYLCLACHKQNISTLQNIKMQKNESLRDFMKRFRQVVLQVASCSMDVILQIFKRSVYLSMLFFESPMKNPSTTMDDLFKLANKYFMLEDDVYAATQQILVTNHLTKNDHAGNSKPSNQLRQANKGRDDHEQSNQASLIPFIISYEKLLSMINDLSDFRWPEPIKMDPTKRDWSRRCTYHKDHGHTTKQCRSHHYLVERLLKVGHLQVRSRKLKLILTQKMTDQYRCGIENSNSY